MHLYGGGIPFSHRIDLENPKYKATAIIRFLLLVLELLEKGLLNFATDWNFEILRNNV